MYIHISFNYNLCNWLSTNRIRYHKNSNAPRSKLYKYRETVMHIKTANRRTCFGDSSLNTHTCTHAPNFTFRNLSRRAALSFSCTVISTLFFHEIGFQAKFRFMFHISELLNCSMFWVTRVIRFISLLLANCLLYCVFSCDLLEIEIG